MTAPSTFPTSSIRTHRPRPLALAARLALTGTLLATAGMAPSFMAAAQAQQQATRAYDIPPGPLAAALTRFIGESGVLLAGTGELAQGKTTPGLRGSYTPGDGLAALLTGTGLEAARTSSGAYVLRPVGVPPAATSSAEGALPLVTVKSSGLGATTEGTGSYTTGSSSTSTGMNLSLRETPQSVSVITRQRMEDQGLTQLSDVVTQTTGLVMAQGGNVGSDSSPIYSRGFQIDTYMIDGVRQVDSNYQDVAQTNDTAIFDRIEVVRGATGLMNGVGTPAGAINMVRKRPTRHFQASARIEAGSWDYARAEADVSSGLNESGSVRGRLVAALQKNHSYIDRLEEERKVLFGTVEADLAANTLLRAGLSWQDHDASGHARGGLPAYYADGTRTNWKRSDSAGASWGYSDRDNTTLFATLEHRLNDDWQLRGTLSRSMTRYDEVLGYASGGNPVKATGAGVNLWASHWQAEPQQDSLDLAASGKFSLFGRQHDAMFGALFSRTSYEDPTYTNWYHTGWSSAISNIYTWDGTTPAEPPNPSIGRFEADERLNSVYGSTRLRATDALSVLLGARLTDWSRHQVSTPYSGKVTTIDLSESGKLTPYAGLVYDLSANWSTYVSYTNIFKAQNFKTLTGDYIEPLQGNSYEAGVKGAFFRDRLNVSAAVYKANQDNLAVSLGAGKFAPDGSQAYEAVSGTTTQGFELEASGEVSVGWQLTAGYARNMTKDRLDKRLLTNVPQNTFKLYTSYRLAQVGNGLTLGGGIRWQSEIYMDAQGPAKVRFTQPEYSVVDLMARYPIDKTFSVAFNVYNLFDTSYLANTGNSYYGAPRNARLALEAKF